MECVLKLRPPRRSNTTFDNISLMPPASKTLGSIAKGLHELRMKDASGQYRVIYLMRSKDAIYLLHGFKKKTQHIELRVRKTIDERLKQI